MGVHYDDGYVYMECDKKDCGLEVRNDPVRIGHAVYHKDCVPT